MQENFLLTHSKRESEMQIRDHKLYDISALKGPGGEAESKWSKIRFRCSDSNFGVCPRLGNRNLEAVKLWGKCSISSRGNRARSHITLWAVGEKNSMFSVVFFACCAVVRVLGARFETRCSCGHLILCWVWALGLFSMLFDFVLIEIWDCVLLPQILKLELCSAPAGAQSCAGFI